MTDPSEFPQKLQDLLATLSPIARGAFGAIWAHLNALGENDRKALQCNLQNTVPAGHAGVAAALGFRSDLEEMQFRGGIFTELSAALKYEPSIFSFVFSDESVGNAPEVFKACAASPVVRSLALQDFQHTLALNTAVQSALDEIVLSLTDENCIGLQKLAIGDKLQLWKAGDPARPRHPLNLLPLLRGLTSQCRWQTQLQGLSFSDLVVENPFTTSCALADYLKSPDCLLKFLELFEGHCPHVISGALALNTSLLALVWDSLDLQSLAGALSQNTTLSTLNLNKCGASDDGLHFASRLSAFKGLTTLKIPFELLSDTGYMMLAESLIVNRSVRVITAKYMSGAPRKIDPTSLREVAKCLSRAPAIERFPLDFSSMTSGEMVEFTRQTGNTLYLCPLGGSVFRYIRPTVPPVFFEVRNKKEVQNFKVPAHFPMAVLLNWVADRFDCSSDQLVLLHADSKFPVYSSTSPFYLGNEEVGLRFPGRTRVDLLVTRGQQVPAVVHAWTRLQLDCDPPVVSKDPPRRLKRLLDGVMVETLSPPSPAPEVEVQRPKTKFGLLPREVVQVISSFIGNPNLVRKF